MIDTGAIRKKILELAMQGKLTTQCNSDSSTENLYMNIQMEKLQLVKGKKIKKQKDFSSISNSEIPFDIPKNWKWVRIGQIFTLQAGKNKTAFEIEEKPKDDKIYPCYGGNGLRGYVNESNVSGKHVLIGRQGALCGNINLAENEFWATEHAVVVYQYANTNVEWVGFALETLDLNRYATSVAQPGLAVGTIENVLIPLPPVEEQKRIADKIVTIFNILSRIDEFQSLYFKDREVLKSKLIDAGIQGKLTVQLLEDGTAEALYEEIQKEKARLIKEKKIKKEKNLAKISEEENPFEIPNNWKWVRLEEISNRIWAGGDKPDDFSKEATEDLHVPVVANGVTDDGILGYTRTAKAPAETITVAGRGTIGFCVYRDYEYCPIVRLIVVEPANGIDPRYLKFVMQAMQESSVGSSIPQLTVPMIKPKLIPLPPYEEQKRIVNRLETLLESI